MNNSPLSKINYIVIGVSVLLIIIGFSLMLGSSTEIEFNPDVFSFRRITVAPIVCMIGFCGIIAGIMIRSNKK